MGDRINGNIETIFLLTCLNKSCKCITMLTATTSHFNIFFHTFCFWKLGRTVSNQDVWDLLTDITHHLSTPVRSKPVEVLQLASEITQAFHGLRITTCKSAKDRTAMSVTLEQIQWLKVILYLLYFMSVILFSDVIFMTY